MKLSTVTKRKTLEQLCRKGHTIFKPSCPSCIELQTEWYTTLQRTGFIDLETNRKTLHQSPIDFNNRSDVKNQVAFEAKQNFYIWAQRQADEAKFHSPVDAKIWSEYSSGITFRSMENSIGLDHTWIYRKVKKIENYLKEQGRSLIASMSYEAAVY